MSRGIRTVSIPEHMEQWMKAHPSFSPSRLLQNAISEQMQVENGELLDTTASLTNKLGRLTEKMEKICHFLDSKGLLQEAQEKIWNE